MELMVRGGADGLPRGVRLPTRAEIELLTVREREVFELLGSGLTNAEIAGHLYISGYTVKAHLGRICAKLGFGTRTVAALAAQRHLLRLCPSG